MTIESTTTEEIIGSAQNAVIGAADSVADIIENTAQGLHGQEAFYEHPTFWVAVSFVLVILILGKPVSKLIRSLLEKRIDGILKRITDAANLKDDAQKLLVEYERKFINAEKEAREILKKAQNEIELLKKESLEKLKHEMNAKEKEAESRLFSAQSKASEEIAKLTSELTIKSVKAAILEKLNEQNQDELIESSIGKIANLK